MTRRIVTVLMVLALAGLVLVATTGCLVGGGGGYGGSYYVQQQTYVCWDVVDHYVWDGYQWVPIYTQVCGWQSLSPEQASDQEIAGVYASEGNVLTLTSGVPLEVNQVVRIENPDNTWTDIEVQELEVSEPAATYEVAAR